MRKTKLITVFLLIGIFLLSSLAAADEIDTNIRKITVQNNEHIDKKIIIESIKTKVGDKFDKEALRQDLQRVMELGYFQDVKASFKNYDGGLEVIIEVVENPLINKINITGNEVYKEAKILNMIGIAKGEILNVKKLNTGLKDLQYKYQDNGYILASYKNVNISKDGILSIDIDIGHINDIIIKGNTKTKDYVIKREIDIKKGQILKIGDIQEAYRNLYRLQYFEDIKPDFKKIEGEKNLANLIINIEEGQTGQFNLGAGYSTMKSWFGYVEIKEKNLLGRGQNLSFNTQFGKKDTTFSLSFYEPWLLGTENSFGISVYDKRTDEKENEENGKYSEHRQGGSISLGRPLTEMWDGNVKFKVEKSETDWEAEDLSKDVHNTRSITLKVDRDTSNHPFNPTGGAIDIFSLEAAGEIFGGDTEFQKLEADLRRYYPGFKEEHAWALRMKTGLGFGEIPPVDKYHLGGSNTLRGYENNIVGNDMLLLNAEYRFPVVDKITGVVFVDSGNAWETRDEMSLENLKTSAGLGARMNTPLGQIRLDYGWNDSGDGKFHFNIGNTF